MDDQVNHIELDPRTSANELSVGVWWKDSLPGGMEGMGGGSYSLYEGSTIMVPKGRSGQEGAEEALGRRVVSLDRIGYAGLDLDGLRRGRWRRLEPHEVNTLRRSVKLKPVVF